MRICCICSEVKSLEDFRLVKKTNKPHSYCKICENAKDRARYESRKKRMLERKKEIYNPVTKKAYNQKYHSEKRDKIISNCKSYYYKNQEKLKADKRQYNIDKRAEILKKKAEYQKRNSEKIAAYTAKREADKIMACPKWLSKDDLLKIKELYKEAKEKTEATGIKHEVDHIVPLRGKNVRGLHVPWNLRVITKNENCKKGNRL